MSKFDERQEVYRHYREWKSILFNRKIQHTSSRSYKESMETWEAYREARERADHYWEQFVNLHDH